MPRYRRVYVPGGTYFFTVVTHQRQPFFADETARAFLRKAFDTTMERRPFEVVAECILPDHTHTIWTLPEGDSDFSRRWGQIKGLFSRWYSEHDARGEGGDTRGKPRPTLGGHYGKTDLTDGNTRAKARPTVEESRGKPRPTLDKACPAQSESRQRRGRVPIWQERFWEHLICDEDDLGRHVEYIHYNPVKHGLVENPRDWQWSSFHRYVSEGVYRIDWGAGGENVDVRDLEFE